MPAEKKLKIIGPKKEQITHTHRDNWEVMKPFVHFSVNAIKVIGIGLIAIVKGVLSLKPNAKHNSTIIKR